MLWMILMLSMANAQADALAAIQKIYNAYNTNNAVRFTGNIKMFARDQPAKLIERMQCRYILQHKKFVCKIGPIEMLLNDSYYVSVDNSDKILIVGRKKDLSAFAGAAVLHLEQLKSLVTGNKIKAIVSVKGSTGILQLIDSACSSGFGRYSIEYSTQSGCMKKVLLETAGNEPAKIMVLEINYSAPEIISANQETFSEKAFFTIVNNKILLSDGYKNYQLVNQL